MMATTISNPFMVEYARIKSKEIEEIEESLFQHEGGSIDPDQEK
ncbi:MAG: hypothetical protein Q6373_006860 [Candidatus Sigynarchaeota archaeon]